jgi:hypothetical protein
MRCMCGFIRIEFVVIISQAWNLWWKVPNAMAGNPYPAFKFREIKSPVPVDPERGLRLFSYLKTITLVALQLSLSSVSRTFTM